jgi:hypothetical protein
METIRRRAVAALEASFTATLAAVDAASNSDASAVEGEDVDIETPVPEAVYDFPVFAEGLVVWPVCLVMARRAPLVGGPNDQGHIARRYELEIEVWFTDADQALLGAWVERAARAVALILESRATWGNLGVFNQRTVDALFSEVVEDESGFMRACQVQFALDALEEETP